MKKYKKLIFTVVGLVVISNAEAGWVKDSTTILPTYISSTYMLNKDIRFALNGHYIFRTIDGGKSWQKDSFDSQIDKNSLIDFHSFKFIDDKIGLVQYQNDNKTFVYKTLDSGKTWHSELLNNTEINVKIKFLTLYNWVAYNNNVIKRTDDGGLNWHVINNPSNDTILYNLEILDNKDIYIFNGNSTSSITLSLSTNLGTSWEKLAVLNITNDSDFMNPMPHFINMSKTAKGLTILFNIYYAGCGYYYHHSKLFYLEKNDKKCRIYDSLFRYNNAPLNLFSKDNISYITTLNWIYRFNNTTNIWYPTFKMQENNFGHFLSTDFINNEFYISTSNGTFFKNNNPITDRNLEIQLRLLQANNTIIYPNPAQNILTFKFIKNYGSYIINILDMNGKIVIDKVFNNETEIVINTSFLPNGTYSYSIINNNKMENGKFIIQN